MFTMAVTNTNNNLSPVEEFKRKAESKIREQNARRWNHCRSCGDKTRAITAKVRVCDVCGIVFIFDEKGEIVESMNEKDFFGE